MSCPSFDLEFPALVYLGTPEPNMKRSARWPSHHDVLSLPSILLLACGSTQPVLRDSSREVPVLAASAEELVPLHMPQADARGSRSFNVVYASSGTRDCDAEQIACFRRCWKADPPWPIEKGDKGHDKYCTKRCREEYMECVKELEVRPRPLTFPDMKAAKDWLSRHETEVLVGSIVVVAGATFVVATGGTGALILLPLAAL
jgi:hypothetical protein